MVHGDLQKGSTRYWNYLENYWPCAGGLSAMNDIGTQLRDLINSELARWRMHGVLHKKMDAAAEIGRNLDTHILPPWEDQREWHRMTRMTRPDCAVMRNLINTHTHTHYLVHGDLLKGSTRYRNYLENYWPCAGGLSAVNDIGTQLRDLVDSELARWRMAFYIKKWTPRRKPGGIS